VKSLYALGHRDRNFEVGNDTAFGVLQLTLAPTSYSWRFVSVTGAVLDSGGPSRATDLETGSSASPSDLGIRVAAAARRRVR
jgi:hypothetical protein